MPSLLPISVDLSAYATPERRTGQPRLHLVFDDYFDGPLDVVAAYWLGFIYADGNVRFKPYWAFTLHLAEKDRAHVEVLHKLIGGVVSTTPTGTRVIVHSRALCLSLARNGVVPNKSRESVRPPALEGAAQQAFLRGLFDGDGCLHISKRGHSQAAFCGHPGIVEWFIDALGVTRSLNRVQRGNTLYASWTGGPGTRDLVHRLYGDNAELQPALPRKAELAWRIRNGWLATH